jgi:TolB-like protein/DNA-binding winged helix-turn-helix (wHTH) protein/Flp pilus assembly protein TadD
VASTPVREARSIQFGEGYELDLRPRRLRRGKQVVKLERIPLEMLVLLVERRDEIVTREEIVARVWGNGVFLDTDNSIRGAIRKLRQALKDDAESPRFIQTVTGQGYRFIAPVTFPAEEDGTATAEPEALGLRPVQEQSDRTMEKPPADEIGRTGKNWQTRKWLFAGAGSLLVLAAVTGYFITRSSQAHSKTPKITSIAVLPLTNLSGDPAQEYFADGMTEELIGRLSMIRGLRVISRTSVMQFKDTKLLAPEIARTLGVDALVEGSVIREGTRVRVHAQLIRASTDAHFWSEEYDRELGDALTLESDVAQSIARRVEVTLTGEERARLVAARPVSPEVYEIYLEGLGTRGISKADVEKRRAYFDEAIKRDPTFAPAYVGLAHAYVGMGSIIVGTAAPNEIRPKVITSAQKALELDPDLPEAHDLLADTYMSQWRWAEAETEFRRALDLNPNDAIAHSGLAEWLMCHARGEEAMAWGRRARELDPLGNRDVIGWELLASRRYGEAIHEFRNELAVEPDDTGMLWDLGWALIFNDQAHEAIPVLEKAVSVSDRNPGIISALIWAYSRDGRRADALRLLGELKRRQQAGYVPTAAFVNAYLGLGDNDEAFAWFERAFQEQSNLLKFIKVFPPFDSVRSDPRFQDLVRRVGLD